MGMDAVIVIVRKTHQMLAGVDVVFIQNAVVLTFQITLNVTIWIVFCRNIVLQGGMRDDLAVVSADLHKEIVVVWFVGTNRRGAVQVGFDVLSVDLGNCTNEHCLLIEHTMINQVAFVGFVTAGGRLRQISVCTHGTVWCAGEVKVDMCV